MTDALIVIDVQRGFADPYWGLRSNPAFEDNLAALLAHHDGPVVLVRHDSREPGSPLAPGTRHRSPPHRCDGRAAAASRARRQWEIGRGSAVPWTDAGAVPRRTGGRHPAAQGVKSSMS